MAGHLIATDLFALCNKRLAGEFLFSWSYNVVITIQVSH